MIEAIASKKVQNDLKLHRRAKKMVESKESKSSDRVYQSLSSKSPKPISSSTHKRTQQPSTEKCQTESPSKTRSINVFLQSKPMRFGQLQKSAEIKWSNIRGITRPQTGQLIQTTPNKHQVATANVQLEQKNYIDLNQTLKNEKIMRSPAIRNTKIDLLDVNNDSNRGSSLRRKEIISARSNRRSHSKQSKKEIRSSKSDKRS